MMCGDDSQESTLKDKDDSSSATSKDNRRQSRFGVLARRLYGAISRVRCG
jgi:hypothetical protein